MIVSWRGYNMLEDYYTIKQPEIVSYESIKQPKKQSQVATLLLFITSLLLIQLLLLIFQSVATQQYSADLAQPRFRLIANSNSQADQLYKKQILENIKPIIEKEMANSSGSINLSTIESEIKRTLAPKIESGEINVQTTKALFPPKRDDYKMYAQDVYKAVVVTIGAGKGDNWWCGLFPKVCYKDKEVKDEKKEKEEEKPKFFIVEWFKKIF